MRHTHTCTHSQHTTHTHTHKHTYTLRLYTFLGETVELFSYFSIGDYLANVLLELPFSRDMEREADEVRPTLWLFIVPIPVLLTIADAPP